MKVIFTTISILVQYTLDFSNSDNDLHLHVLQTLCSHISIIILFFLCACIFSVLTLIIKLTEYFVGKGTEYGVVGPCRYFCRMEML